MVVRFRFLRRFLARFGRYMLLMSAFHAVVPFFGVLLSGRVGTMVYLVLAAVWAYCTWLCTACDRRRLVDHRRGDDFALSRQRDH